MPSAMAFNASLPNPDNASPASSRLPFRSGNVNFYASLALALFNEIYGSPAGSARSAQEQSGVSRTHYRGKRESHDHVVHTSPTASPGMPAMRLRVGVRVPTLRLLSLPMISRLSCSGLETGHQLSMSTG